jgi:hypothetical protein
LRIVVTTPDIPGHKVGGVLGRAEHAARATRNAGRAWWRSPGAVTDRGLPCTRPHYWETFAIAILPADARTFDQPTLEKNPAVNAVCSVRVLLASRRGRALRIPLSAWRVDVLPPSEAAFYSGARTYRCVANVVGRQPRTSLFHR